MSIPVPHASRYVTVLFLLVFFGAAALMIQLLAVYLAAIVLALVLRSLFSSMHDRVELRFKRKDVAAGVSTTIVVALVLVPIGGFVAALSAQAVSVYEQVSGDEGLFQKLSKQLQTGSPMASWVHDQGARIGLDLSPERVLSLVNEAATAIGTFAYQHVGGFASNTFGVIMNFSMMIIVLFALFSEGGKLKAYILDLSPLPDEQELMLVDRFTTISRSVFVGNGVGSVLQGVLGGISFYMFGLGNGVLWGAAIAFFAFLPVVGASVVVIPAAIYLFATGSVGAGIGFVVFNAVYIGILEYGLKTKLIGGQMNGVLVFVGIVAGLGVFGILGLFYGPLILTMFLTLADIYKVHYRDDLMSLISPWVRRDAGAEVDIVVPDREVPAAPVESEEILSQPEEPPEPEASAD
jgi:predicted PurR-regulated permease PerM